MLKRSKSKKPTSPVEGQHGDYQLKEKDTKKEKRGSGSSRKKNTSSESSQSEPTVSTKLSTTTPDVSHSGERPQVRTSQTNCQRVKSCACNYCSTSRNTYMLHLPTPCSKITLVCSNIRKLLIVPCSHA